MLGSTCIPLPVLSQLPKHLMSGVQRIVRLVDQHLSTICLSATPRAVTAQTRKRRRSMTRHLDFGRTCDLVSVSGEVPPPYPSDAYQPIVLRALVWVTIPRELFASFTSDHGRPSRRVDDEESASVIDDG
jgi:hypothetical protein